MMFHVAIPVRRGIWENLCNEKTPRFGNNEGWLALEDILEGFEGGDHICPCCAVHPDYPMLVLASQT